MMFVVKGIQTKGPYLPCVSMAVGPFWQDTIKFSMPSITIADVIMNMIDFY